MLRVALSWQAPTICTPTASIQRQPAVDSRSPHHRATTPKSFCPSNTFIVLRTKTPHRPESKFPPLRTLHKVLAFSSYITRRLLCTIPFAVMASSSNIQHAVGFSGDHNREQFAHDQSIVRKIRVVVHTTGPWPNSPMSDHHVSVYLLLDNGRSVRINMTTQSNDDRGILYWTQLSYQQSNSAIIFFDYDAAAGLMVGHVYSMVREAGLHRYRFSGGGSGCRFWM